MVEFNCECLLPSSENKDEGRHLPRHPATWHLDSASAAVPAVCPTSAEYSHPDGVQILWNSRSHRKGRCPKLISADGRSRLAFSRPPLVILNLDVRNPSWWVGCLFTLGSALWVVHGALIMVLVKTEAQYYAQSWSSLIGISFFTLGAYLATLEALNADPSVKLSYVLVKADPDPKQ